MTMIERIVKERNEALFSLDREKIEAYMKKYGESDMKDVPEDLFWTSVYKAVCEIKAHLKTWLILREAGFWLME